MSFRYDGCPEDSADSTGQGSNDILSPPESVSLDKGTRRSEKLGVLRGLLNRVDWGGCRYDADQAPGRQHVSVKGLDTAKSANKIPVHSSNPSASSDTLSSPSSLLLFSVPSVFQPSFDYRSTLF